MALCYWGLPKVEFMPNLLHQIQINATSEQVFDLIVSGEGNTALVDPRRPGRAYRRIGRRHDPTAIPPYHPPLSRLRY